MTAGQLTEFQKQCRESIGGMLHDLGLAVTYKLVEGLQGSYLIGRVERTRSEIYIYADEAGFFVAGKWFGYETQDFPDSTDLIARLSRDLKDKLEPEH